MHSTGPRVSNGGRRSYLIRAAALALCAELPLATAADDSEFRYRGREYTPTGSNVSRRLTWSSKLPFDKKYDELTAAQIAYVRDQYDGLKPDEEPPFPKDGLRDVFRHVDENVDQSTPRLEAGALMVVASVDANGAVQSLKFYKTPNGFAMGALGQALMHTPFKPAKRNGAPVPMDFLLSADLL